MCVTSQLSLGCDKTRKWPLALLKATKEDKKEIEEATASLVEANESNVGAAVALVLSGLDDIFTLKEEQSQEQHCRLISAEKMFSFPPDLLLVRHSSPRDMTQV